MWWLVAAISFAMAKTNDSIVDVTATSRKILRVASWALVFLFGTSTIATWRIARNQDTVFDNAFNDANHGMHYDPELNVHAQQYETQYRTYT